MKKKIRKNFRIKKSRKISIKKIGKNFQNLKPDSELSKLIENFINSSGGSYSLVSARELNDEPKCLLSGDFLCSEVVANSSAEVVEYFKQVA